MIREVLPAFDMLLEELDAIIPIVNEQGSRLMREKKYQEARATIDRAEAIDFFQKKVVSLRDEWERMEVPATRDLPESNLFDRYTLSSPKRHRRSSASKLRDGLRTSNDELRLPILQAIIALGGKAKYENLIQKLEELLRDRLNKYDWEPLASDPNSIRWHNNVGWAKKPLRDLGYLVADSPIGTWEITEKGRAASLQKTLEPTASATLFEEPIRNRLTTYNFQYHTRGKSTHIRNLLLELRKKILELDTNIEEVYNKLYISFRVSQQTFVEVHVQTKQLKMWIKPLLHELRDPSNWCRDVSRVGHYGNGPSEFNISNSEQITYALNLIEQSMKFVLKN